MATQNFSASLSKWASQTEQRIGAVHRRAVAKLGEEMATTKPQGGRVPFKTGNLARSILADKNAMPKTSTEQAKGSNVGLVAATLKPNEQVYIGYTAAYARRMNYGFVGADSLGRVYNQTGNYFVEGAIAQWKKIVRDAAREVRAGI